MVSLVFEIDVKSVDATAYHPRLLNPIGDTS